ncbi:circadian clock protein KaiC [Polystyrenella longa]|uniref:Circadian clock protein KaiC n=1 Tax=Polystyrenella longa TaxID=2528007 RepID=A0A518CR49_9PLAN|nr:ATPase domain-containing protein [Polystyrenella longa]QDU81688.1 circadian clock protein KaiC [Polystyrenella longa]
MTTPRHSTGLSQLDEMLGGGLIPGTMTVVMGSTGIGKTQLGLQFAHAGKEQEGETGILFDMTSRGDAQNQDEYAKRLFDWDFRAASNADIRRESFDVTTVWDAEQSRKDYLHLFRRSGRRVTLSDLDDDQWREWKVELSRKLDRAIYFFYGNFVHGVRRIVLDGIEPAEKASDSFQFHMIDYVYHQVLRKESDWLARDLFRSQFRSQESIVEQHPYDHQQLSCLILYTCHEVMLNDLLERPIESGDMLSNANTIILMGKTREEGKMGRALQIAKHRGSACDESIVPFQITEKGLQL